MPVLSSSAMKLLNENDGSETWLGRGIAAWSERVVGAKIDRLSNLDRLNRVDLFRRLKSLSSAEEKFLAISAWGGMRLNNGRRAWAAREAWIPALDRLSGDCHTRAAAYALFAKLRSEEKLPGVGPAYYTKLIYFLRPDLNGYIMDQWTARSVNLLFGSTIVRMQGNVVHDSNTADVYEAFCKCIEVIAAHLVCEADEAEARLFSSGGKRPSKWRTHVKEFG